MINQLFRCIFFLLISATAILSAEVPAMPAKITVRIRSSQNNTEIKGDISIVRLSGQQVDEASFTIDGQTLPVKKVADRLPAGNAAVDKNTVVISEYTFSLPGKPRGLYLFPPVKVKVGGVVIASAPVSFEVTGVQVSDELQLQAQVKEKGPFYPGQKITFQYIISFRNPIQLTREKLPLLEFPGFRTVGAPKIENMPYGANTMQVISQQAVALEPGTFSSGPSFIEGYMYGQDAYGNKAVSQTLLQAQAPDVQVEVLPFPKPGQPASFNGALGIFYWKVRTKGSTNVAVGEKITLEVTVSGSGDYDSVNFPDLSLQKGFKDLFRLSDLAPVGEMIEGQKRFTVSLRPVVQGIKEIPSIEFSCFDPISKTYVTWHSDPIAITVRPGKKIDREDLYANDTPPAVWPIEVQGNIELEESDIRTRHMQNIILVYTALLLLAVLAAQHLFKKMWLDSQARGVSSRDIILDAIKHKSNPDTCSRLLRKALLLRLFEVGMTTTVVDHPEELSQEGLQGEIRRLLISIEQNRFMGLETQVEMKEIINEASQLYYRMK